ncbi:hypothetical protein WJX73_009277 [Symbiochloris irregularis]|uniref:BZIP domain-containing protein n=1 Tax=Symbiochloris irregularis TaxID=706552 RepID=A0AAW1PFG7_9CHLO
MYPVEQVNGFASFPSSAFLQPPAFGFGVAGSMQYPAAQPAAPQYAAPQYPVPAPRPPHAPYNTNRFLLKHKRFRKGRRTLRGRRTPAAPTDTDSEDDYFADKSPRRPFQNQAAKIKDLELENASLRTEVESLRSRLSQMERMETQESSPATSTAIEVDKSS